MKKKKKVRLKIGNIIIFSVFVVTVLFLFVTGLGSITQKIMNPSEKVYIASLSPTVQLYNKEFKEAITLTRGEEVTLFKKTVTNEETKEEYNRIEYKNKKYLLPLNSTKKNKEEVVLETTKYVRTPVTVYEKNDDLAIAGTAAKGTMLEVVGYDVLNSDGTVTMYHIKTDETEGYVYSKYLVDTKEDALKNYDEEGIYKIHNETLADPYGVGSAGNLDFYPYEKAKFENNVMPDTVKALYLNGSAIKTPETYINIAKDIGANAFVVDIKDGGAAYASPIMEQYSKTTYNSAQDTMENYKNNVQKLKDAGFYVVGRIVTFNDPQYGVDNKEDVIVYKSNGALFDGNYWITPYSRRVWEYNVKLAVEAVKEIGFNEIQFDYVRFPDRTTSVNHLLDFKDRYGESKAQAVQNFLFYATDEIHKAGAYVSADVFGETSGNYVTGYGQYWPAISNVVDVISGMPYPDHFNPHYYGIQEVVWTVPEKLLTLWSAAVVARQKTIPTPAIVRTWIQAFDVSQYKTPSIPYGDAELAAQIQGLYNNGLTGGWITWNSNSSVAKYSSFTTAFKREYQ